ncbi:hypothetical protein [Arthrobacter sp. zg-Y1110]|uniref:hypothetical protein n=1 Tax=Arthrobacter sp. zg-Y1110 TaxID=2886932 RepID=UPI001D15C545|nr:hypothetical protein [Arthrobacter sp. zg-Y1110]MCC3292958.1 hypothetical protein [Arthrobacter sp. zg-Y1110]UWX86897.1 hypothetical protein N2K99_18815 [Arthrobacter sp. zg-Y1110]
MPTMVKIDGKYINADTILRVVPDNDGTVMVSQERRHWEFTVGEGNEEQWAADFAAQLGPVVDTSATPVERG